MRTHPGWVLVVMALSLSRAAASMSGRRLARATTATIRGLRSRSWRGLRPPPGRLILHLPQRWRWEHEWNGIFEALRAPKSWRSPNYRHHQA